MHTYNPYPPRQTCALWRQAFRPFFLGGALFSVLALALWAVVLAGKVNFTPYGGPLFWHAHEMLFGFGSAIICGFLLTAVQNWTGIRATNGRPLAALFALWLSARIMIALNIPHSQWLLVVVDVSFFPTLALLVGRLLVQARSYGNLILLPVLLTLGLANLATHASVWTNDPQLFRWGTYSAAALTTLLIVIIGGRVIPMFTASGTYTRQVAPLRWLERTVLLSTLAITLIYVTQLERFLPDYLVAALFAVSALSHGYRAARWRVQVTTKTPLVWSLHLAYWFIPLGFALFALHYAGIGFSSSAALHGLTAGAMGSIILAMITRVSLGHTGRSFTINKVVALSFGLIVLAGIARLLGGLFPAVLGIHAYGLAVIFWILAYSIFLINNAKPLFTPRPDGGIS